MGDFITYISEGVSDVPSYNEYIKDNFDSLIEIAIDEILDEFWYVDAEIDLKLTDQQEKELLDYALDLDDVEPDVAKAMENWYDEMMRAEDSYDTRTQSGRDRTDEMWSMAASEVLREVAGFLNVQIRGFSEIQQQLKEIEIIAIKENPENIKHFPTPSLELQKLALQLGGKHIFLKIQSPHPEIEKEFKHITGLKKSGILEWDTPEHIKKYMYGAGKKLWDRSDNQTKIERVNKQPLFAIFFNDPPPEDIIGKMYKNSKDLLSWVHWNADDPRFIESARVFIKKNPESFFYVIGRSFRPGEDQTRVDQHFWDFLNSYHPEWTRERIASIAAAGKNMIMPLEYEKMLIDDHPAEISGVYPLSKEGQEYFLEKHGRASYPLLKNPHPEIQQSNRYQDSLRRSGIMRARTETFKEFSMGEEEQTPKEEAEQIQMILQNEFPDMNWALNVGPRDNYYILGNMDSKAERGFVPKFDSIIDVSVDIRDAKLTRITAIFKMNTPDPKSKGFFRSPTLVKVYSVKDELVERRAEKITKAIKQEIDALIQKAIKEDPEGMMGNGDPRKYWPKEIIEKVLRADPFAIKYYRNPPKEHQQIAVDTKKAAFEFIDNPDPEIEKQFKYVGSLKRSGIMRAMQ